MDEQSNIIKERPTLEQQNDSVAPNVNNSSPRERTDILFLILFGVIIFCIVFAGVYYLGTGKSIVPQIQVAMQPSGAMPKNEYPEVIQKTQIAQSLILPPLYNNFQWQDVTDTASVAGNLSSIVEITGKSQTVTVAFPVANIFQVSNVPIEANKYTIVSGYYNTQLSRLGWVSSKNPYLTFKTFRIDALQEDNHCGGKEQFLGYTSGQVRLVTVIYEIKACTSFKQPQNMKVDYTLFTSKPLSLQYITNYIQSHAK